MYTNKLDGLVLNIQTIWFRV